LKNKVAGINAGNHAFTTFLFSRGEGVKVSLREEKKLPGRRVEMITELFYFINKIRRIRRQEKFITYNYI